MDRLKKKLIWDNTELISMTNGGNKLFRAGVLPISSYDLGSTEFLESHTIQPKQFCGNNFYQLIQPTVAHGFFWNHNGPSADWFFFKSIFTVNDDINNVSLFKLSDASKNEYFTNSILKSLYDDFDWPIGGINICIEEVVFKKRLHSDELFLKTIQQLVNYTITKMVRDNYFEIYKHK